MTGGEGGRWSRAVCAWLGRWRDRLLALCLLAAGLVHLLGLWLTDRALRPALDEVVYRVHLDQLRPPIVEYAPEAPVPSGPQGALARLGVEAGSPRRWTGQVGTLAGGAAGGSGGWLPPGDGSAPLPWGTHRLAAPTRGQWQAPVETTLTVEAINLAQVRRHAEEVAAYSRPWMPEADTSQASSARRQEGQQIVLAAVKAMGGAAALSAVQAMLTQPRRDEDRRPPPPTSPLQLTRAEIEDVWTAGRICYRKHGLQSTFAQYVRGGRLVFDGDSGWMVVQQTLLPVTGPRLLDLQQRAERWDFLSRYLGDGVTVSSLGPLTDAHGQALQLVRVDDRKFGGVTFRACFDPRTHLLVKEEFPAERPTLRWRFLEYRTVGAARLWSQVESTVLTAARYTPDTLEVIYDEVPAEAFDLPAPSPAPPPQAPAEGGPTLWVDVHLFNHPYNGVPVARQEDLGLVSEKVSDRAYGTTQAQRDTAQYLLSYGQRRAVEQQVLAAAVAAMARDQVCPRVLPYEEGQAQPQDLVLRVLMLRIKGGDWLRGTGFYGAQLYDATTDEALMSDGPVVPHYVGVGAGGDVSEAPRLHAECRPYQLPIFVVEHCDAAYVSPGKLGELLDRTAGKILATRDARQRGAPLPHNGRCCYCQ